MNFSNTTERVNYSLCRDLERFPEVSLSLTEVYPNDSMHTGEIDLEDRETRRINERIIANNWKVRVGWRRRFPCWQKLWERIGERAILPRETDIDD